VGRSTTSNRLGAFRSTRSMLARVYFHFMLAMDATYEIAI
jgi:hypothetical protein